MAIKATIHKAQLQIADMDRAVYADHNVIIARHPSETDERMMIRLLAFRALRAGRRPARQPQVPKTCGMWTAKRSRHKDFYTDAVLHWIDVGQPDDKRLMRAAGRAERVGDQLFKQHAGLVERH